MPLDRVQLEVGGLQSNVCTSVCYEHTCRGQFGAAQQHLPTSSTRDVQPQYGIRN